MHETPRQPIPAPLEQHLTERNTEIALARSAAPESIARDAEVMVLRRRGYESWPRARTASYAPAARTYLPITIKKTDWFWRDAARLRCFEDVKAVFDTKESPAVESGAMCYMLSKQGSLSDRDGH